MKFKLYIKIEHLGPFNDNELSTAKLKAERLFTRYGINNEELCNTDTCVCYEIDLDNKYFGSNLNRFRYRQFACIARLTEYHYIDNVIIFITDLTTLPEIMNIAYVPANNKVCTKLLKCFNGVLRRKKQLWKNIKEIHDENKLTILSNDLMDLYNMDKRLKRICNHRLINE